jgi:cell division protein FtsQ
MKPSASDNYSTRTRKIVSRRHFRFNLRRGFYIAAAVLVFVVVANSLWVWYQGTYPEMKAGVERFGISVSSHLGMNLKNVYISGQTNTQTRDIARAIDLKKGTPILSVSLDKVRERVEELGWVEEATVERRLPATINVRIKERRPIAVWQHEGQVHLVDSQGEVITAGTAGVKNDFTGLPIVVGEEAHNYVSHLFSFLFKERELFNQVSSIIRIGGRRWNIRLKSGIEVLLPEEKPEAAWRYLAKLQREKQVLDRAISSVDLRLHDRIFIKKAD